MISDDHLRTGIGCDDATSAILGHHTPETLFDSIVSPSVYWGIETHTEHRVSAPCWPH